MTINYAKHDEEFHGVFKLVSGEEILAKAVLTTEDYGTDTKESLAFLQDPVCIQIIDKAMGVVLEDFGIPSFQIKTIVIDLLSNIAKN